jgi:hypothetical protein
MLRFPVLISGFFQAAPFVICLVFAVSGCRNIGTSEALALKSSDAPTAIMVDIAKSAQTCWFKSDDRAFSGFRLANEVNSPAGRPRVLLVPKHDPSALPLLVIQAEHRNGAPGAGRYTDIQAFGPILATVNGKRITDDIQRWTSGNQRCK